MRPTMPTAGWDTLLTVILSRILGTTWVNPVKQKGIWGLSWRQNAVVRLRILLNCCVYTTAIGHVSTKAISKSQEYHAAQARHSRQGETQAVTALPQACCFADVPVVPPDSCEWVSLPGAATSRATSGSPWCVQSPKAEIALRQLGFFRSLCRFQIHICTTFHKYDTANVFFYSFATILMMSFFQG